MLEKVALAGSIGKVDAKAAEFEVALTTSPRGSLAFTVYAESHYNLQLLYPCCHFIESLLEYSPDSSRRLEMFGGRMGSTQQYT